MGVGQVLLVADETALPAVAGILEELAAMVDPPRTLALLEVAQAGDAVHLKAPSSAELVWLPRGRAAYGQPLLQAVEARLAAAPGAAAAMRWRRSTSIRRSSGSRPIPAWPGRCMPGWQARRRR